MVKTYPNINQKFVKKKRQVIYLRLQIALYGMMKSALLFYKKLIKELKEMGFEINPYDPCMGNKLVCEKQMTVRWHVNDLMISHINKGQGQDTQVCEVHERHLRR